MAKVKKRAKKFLKFSQKKFVRKKKDSTFAIPFASRMGFFNVIIEKTE